MTDTPTAGGHPAARPAAARPRTKPSIHGLPDGARPLRGLDAALAARLARGGWRGLWRHGSGPAARYFEVTDAQATEVTDGVRARLIAGIERPLAETPAPSEGPARPRRAASPSAPPAPAAPGRAPDTLARLLEEGLLDPPAYEAGRRFQAEFDFGQLSEVPIGRYGAWTPAGTAARDLPERAEEARRRVARALEALGTLAAPAAKVVWWVVGHRLSFAEFAPQLRGDAPGEGSAGSTARAEARGMLAAALGVLATHYGTRTGPRLRQAEAEAAAAYARLKAARAARPRGARATA